MFTNLSGASKVFVGGVVCYANDVKVSVGVPESISTLRLPLAPNVRLSIRVLPGAFRLIMVLA